jgi:NAD(P)-dependent dehydrogenase (short-subunit alcohol dehydrogenase family)
MNTDTTNVSETGSKVVLVVGASSGIGQATAAELVRRGYQVFGTSRDAERVQTRGVTALSLEVLNQTSIESAVAAVVKATRRLDAVVYSAGFYLAGTAEETSSELALAQLDIYFLGAHRVMRAVLPQMREQRSGRIIFMSSSAGVAAIPFHSLYSASKAALEHYVEAVRYEVAPFNIEATCIQGTGVRTGTPLILGSDAFTPYEPARSAVIRRFRQMQMEGPEPDGFARCIADALDAPKLRSLYRVGATAKFLPWLRAVLPERAFRAAYRRAFSAERFG